MSVIIVDDLQPEDIAMVQALYSRSSRSVTEHIAEVAERGSGSFMSKFYVGYGHKSIGDCGTTTLFFENVSMLAAKAIQDNSLYSGQETSTRYIDFASQGYVDPTHSSSGIDHLESMVSFYRAAFAETLEYVNANAERPHRTKQSVWDKATKARAFDICRAFLPAGMKTQLSWATNLRQASDHVSRLMMHPLEEIRDLAVSASKLLQSKYPSSFDFDSPVDERAFQYAKLLSQFAYADNDCEPFDETKVCFDRLNKSRVVEFAKLTSSRPRGMELPGALESAGQIQAHFYLDFGSFRDLQRHRGVGIEMPLLKPSNGFEPWYLDNLSPVMKNRAQEHLDTVFSNAQNLSEKYELSPAEAQYLLPMGNRVECKIVGSLPKLIYLLELRSNITVHPTLRAKAWDVAAAIQREFPDLRMHIDTRPDEFQVKRGEQDIVRVDAA